MNTYKLGSLFDGSGGFPLAGFLCNIVPVWAAEVEPYPIAVTRSRFPHMKHLGDVSKINGAEIEPVDIITFGSPCQDLSVAGKRAGLKHEANGDEETTRSGLFMEAVRIIKEMREATNGKYPRIALWENVPGAFSSNKGADFRVVLEELIKIVEPSAVMPQVPKAGWAYADYYSGDGWSLAYRTLDSQLWGVPQRRRRCYLVLDLGGQCAGEISFKRDGLRGYFAEGRAPWKAIAGDAGNSAETADCEGVGLDIYNLAVTGEVAASLTTATGQGASNTGPSVLEPVVYNGENITHPLNKTNPQPGDPCHTLGTDSRNYVVAVDQGGGKSGANFHHELSPTLTCTHGGEPAVAYAAYGWPLGFRPENTKVYEETATTICNGTRPGFTAGVIQQVADAHILDDQGGSQIDDKTCTLRAGASGGACGVTVCFDARGNGDGAVVPTITGDHNNRVTDYTSVVCEAKPKTVCLEGNGNRPSHSGNGWIESDVMYTLNTIERHGVAYAMQGFGDYKDTKVSSSLKQRDYKDATDLVVENSPVVLDRAFYNQGINAQYDPQFYEDGTVPTLVAKGPAAVCTQYIVRRLTPTECARLQGFPDDWGHPDHKDDFTDEEYRFWLDVRNTHAEVNGKAVKDYTKDQMLKWYNKLHTDSSEYKMWGNGIALPTALYVMQGIEEALRG